MEVFCQLKILEEKVELNILRKAVPQTGEKNRNVVISMSGLWEINLEEVPGRLCVSCRSWRVLKG